jgi:hypothetical protein
MDRRSLLAIASMALSVVACTLHSAAAAESPPPVAPCSSPEYHQFDFWVGDWQVFDAATHQLVGFDHVAKLAEGCIVQQNISMLTDLYRRPGVPYRMSGISVNRFDGERWLELWADNQWGAIALKGAPDAKAAMVLTTIIPSRNRDMRLVWEQHVDGSVEIFQYVAVAGSGKWETVGDLIYRPNLSPSGSGNQ